MTKSTLRKSDNGFDPRESEAQIRLDPLNSRETLATLQIVEARFVSTSAARRETVHGDPSP